MRIAHGASGLDMPSGQARSNPKLVLLKGCTYLWAKHGFKHSGNFNSIAITTLSDKNWYPHQPRFTGWNWKSNSLPEVTQLILIERTESIYSRGPLLLTLQEEGVIRVISGWGNRFIRVGRGAEDLNLFFLAQELT